MNQKTQTLALLLAKAGEELLPQARVFLFKASGFSFQADFLFPNNIDATILAHIEARLRTKIRKKEEIVLKTFVKSNAISYLLSLGRNEQAKIVENEEVQCVDLAFDESWCVCCPEGEFEALSGQEEIQLIEEESYCVPCGIFEGKKALSLRGLFAETKKELVESVKNFKQRKPLREILESKGLLSLHSDRAIFLSKGKELISHLYALWEEEMGKHKIQSISFSMHDPKELFDIMKERNLSAVSWWGIRKEISEHVVKDFFSVSDPVGDLVYAEISKEDAFSYLSSALQFIRKIYTIFGLSCNFELFLKKGGNKMLRDVLVTLSYPFYEEELRKDAQTYLIASFCDRRGRRFPLSKVVIEKEAVQKIVVAQSLFLSLERTIAMAIEWNDTLFASGKHKGMCTLEGEEKNFESQ